MKNPQETVLWILKVQDRWIDEKGIQQEELKWEIAEKNINLGSTVNPNPDIRMIKYAPRGISLSQVFGLG